MHVPIEFRLLEGGQSEGLLPRKRKQQTTIATYLAPSAIKKRTNGNDGETDDTEVVREGHVPSASTSAVKSHRWNISRDGAALMSIISSEFDGQLPQSLAQVRQLAAEMPVSISGAVWDGEMFRDKAKEY